MTNRSNSSSRRRQDRLKTEIGFAEAEPSELDGQVTEIVARSIDKWKASNLRSAKNMQRVLQEQFPDEYSADDYWTRASEHQFRDFFTWGHDHDFGFGIKRSGAMGARHVEIITECVRYGLLPHDLSGTEVLDVGCWSGGDVLLLAGLGGRVTAVEEHLKSAASAEKLCNLVGCPLTLVTKSIYEDRKNWQGKFDVVYASGVVYHVTDPLLFVRILFAYLRIGGRLVLETKSHHSEEAVCGYSGTLERGWNWFAPNAETLGRWFVDAGFDFESIRVHPRKNGRLLGMAIKTEEAALPETAGFSRPGSWLEGLV